MTRLHDVARTGPVSELCQLLAAGGNTEVDARDKHSRTPLHIAAWAGQEAVVEELLRAGASRGAGAKDDMNSLHFAAQQGHAGVCNILLDSGLSVDRRNRKGQTALHIAAAKGHSEVVKCLLERKANPTAANRRNVEPLEATTDAVVREILTAAISKRAEQKRKREGDEKEKPPLRQNIRKQRHEAGVDNDDEPGSKVSIEQTVKASQKDKIALTHLGDEEDV